MEKANQTKIEVSHMQPVLSHIIKQDKKINGIFQRLCDNYILSLTKGKALRRNKWLANQKARKLLICSSQPQPENFESNKAGKRESREIDLHIVQTRSQFECCKLFGLTHILFLQPQTF
jgi:hypothetical protein